VPILETAPLHLGFKTNKWIEIDSGLFSLCVPSCIMLAIYSSGWMSHYMMTDFYSHNQDNVWIMVEDNVKSNWLKMASCHPQLKEITILWFLFYIQTANDPECWTLNSQTKCDSFDSMRLFHTFLSWKFLADQWLVYWKETAPLCDISYVMSDSADGRWLNSWNI